MVLVIGTMLVSCEKSLIHDSAPGPTLSVIMPDTIWQFEPFTVDASKSTSANGEELDLCISLMNGGRYDEWFEELKVDSLMLDYDGNGPLVFWITVREQGRGWQDAKRFEIPYIYFD